MANTTGRKLKQKSSSEKKTVTIKRQSTAKKEKKKKGKAADVTVDVNLELSGSEGDTPKEFEVEIEYVTKCRPLSRIYIKYHRWTKDLTWKLVNGILDDAEVKQGLFPTPGGNLSLLKGGSKNKSDYHWALANIIFEDDPVFGPKISAKDADRKFWQLKVKNKLQ